MPRFARIVVPGIPHHIIQRGNRKQAIFFNDEDRQFYLRILKTEAERFSLELWGYCLMPNHVHLIAVPQTLESFRAISETHRRYAWQINSKNDWRGHLWQGRFGSFPMDEAYLYMAMRYVERNPVRAGMVLKAWDYPWSSARAHINGDPSSIIKKCFLQETISDWKGFFDCS